MRRDTMGEVTTHLVDVNGLSLAELRSTDNPVLLRSLELTAGRTDRSHTGVRQNQAPDEY